MAKTKKTTAKTDDLTEELRRAIADSGKTHYALGKESGVRPEMIDRFCSGERDLRLATAAKLARVLKLRLRPA